MEVDLSKLEAGQTVGFRCGGEAVVDRAKPSNLFSGGVFISYKDSEYGCHYTNKGNLKSQNGTFETTPYDIIEVIPKPFDWKDVKPGNGFFETDNIDQIWVYIGPYVDSEGHAVFFNPDTRNLDFWSIADNENQSFFTRSRKHDIEVQ